MQRPQITTFGRDAYPTFADKAAALAFAILANNPFRGSNRRVALTAIVAFCELNGRTLDSRLLDDKAFENLFKRVATHRELGLAPENVFREFREAISRAVVAAA